MKEGIAGCMIGLLFMWWVFTVFAIRKWFKHFRHLRNIPRLRDAWAKKSGG